MIDISVKDQTFSLLPEKVVYWNETQTLILSDLHLGKSGHFRKSGIAAPQQINETNLKWLANVTEKMNPKRIFILGDLFHSDANKEWLQFEKWRKTFFEPKIYLIKGNHDLLHQSFYKRANIPILNQKVESGFRFIHHPIEKTDEDLFAFCGHVHPGVNLRGTGGQSLKLPCFYQTDTQMILPAFGKFTGLHLLKYSEAKRVFVIVDRSVIELQKK